MAKQTIEVIVPVRDMAGHLPKLLRPLMAQLADGDRVTVVDDASSDDTASVARFSGANVVTLTGSKGPYYARQVAASRSTADTLLFIDGRCRPLPGLLDAHREHGIAAPASLIAEFGRFAIVGIEREWHALAFDTGRGGIGITREIARDRQCAGHTAKAPDPCRRNAPPLVDHA